MKLNVGSHPHFKRDGFDIHYEASISMAQAALGTSIPVPTLTGEVMLKVAPGTQPGEKRIMRGKGIKMLNRAAYGDEYVHFKVNVPGPNKLNKKSRELLEQFAREQGEQCNWTTPNPAMASAADTATAADPAAAAAATAAASSSSSSPSSAAASDATAQSADAAAKDAKTEEETKAKKKKGGVLGSLFK